MEVKLSFLGILHDLVGSVISKVRVPQEPLGADGKARGLLRPEDKQNIPALIKSGRATDRPHSRRDTIPISGYKKKRRWWEGKRHSAGLRCIWTSGTPGQATDLPRESSTLAPHLLRHALKTVPSLLSAPDLQHPGWRRFGARQGRMATGAESPAPGCSVAASVDTWHPLLQSVREAVCVCPTPRGRHASAPCPGRGSPGSHCTSHEASCAHPPPLDPPDPLSKQLTGEKPA